MPKANLSEFQIEVAKAFFELSESANYLVAGGAALIASNLVSRPTQDIDLFAHAPTDSVTPARNALSTLAEKRKWSIREVHDSPTFSRLVISKDNDDVLVDLAIESRPSSPPTISILGPTMNPLELGGRKLLALFDRAEARDFSDVYQLSQQFGAQQLINAAEQLDSGFNIEVLKQMMPTLDRFTNEEIPIDENEVYELRAFFRAWPNPTKTYEDSRGNTYTDADIERWAAQEELGEA